MIHVANIASLKMHNAMLHAVLYSPMAWFHSFVNGKIANRFASDVGEIDWMAGSFWWLSCNIAWVIASVVLVGISAPYFLVLIVPVSIV